MLPHCLARKTSVVNVQSKVSVKALVRKLVRKTIGAPMLWLGLGVAAICASLGISYSRAQVNADYAMLLRLGPPEAVAVEEAEVGAVGEAHVIASFDPELAVAIGAGESGSREWLAVPLFAAAPIADGVQPRPQARPEATGGALLEAAGLALFPRGQGGLDRLVADGQQGFAGALNGPFLVLDAAMAETAVAELSAIGVALAEGAVVIRPWTEGRAAALAPPPDGPLSRYLFWAGLLGVLGAIGLSLRPEESDRYLTITPAESERKVVTKSRILADEGRFNPLIGQDDIRRGAMERLHASERAQGRTPSTFFTNSAVSKLGAGWVKNRR
ncbi:MAG: hypothetical protein QNJ13_02825 [Paracoccaceae bacterium]|nr:hypothetical protein [Paracoccaceae bacterium]